MESVDPVKNQCSICSKYYTGTMTLICGHNFCRNCIDCVLKTQEGFGDYRCTECGQRFSIHPVLESSISLRNTVEHFQRTLLQQKDSEVRFQSGDPTHILFTPNTFPEYRKCPIHGKVLEYYCIEDETFICDFCRLDEQHWGHHQQKYAEVRFQSGGPKHVLSTSTMSPESRKCPTHGKVLEYYCIEDETFICDFCRLDEQHWGHHQQKYSEVRFWSAGPTQILLTPTTSPKTRKCLIHGKVLEYYCFEDTVLMCDFCRLDWQHWGHQVEKVDEVSEENLEYILKKLLRRTTETEERVRSQYRDKKTIHIAASDKAAKFNILYRFITMRLEKLKDTVLNEISSQKEEASLSVLNRIRQLEEEREELSMDIGHIKELRKKTGPPTILQKSDTGDLWDLEEQKADEYSKKLEIPLLPNVSFLDVDQISYTLNEAVSQSYKVLEQFRTIKSSFLQKEEVFRSSDADTKITTKDPESKGVSVVPSIYGEVYSLYLGGAGLFRCSETKILFQVRSTMCIQYQLESGSNHMTETLNNGYQIISPLFNLNIQESSQVSAVYLPHCLSSKDYETYKQYIKLVHFKDGKMILESPTRVEPSYIVLENPTFSLLWAMVEKFWTFISRPFAFNGIVLIYGKAEKDYCLRLYTMIDNQPDLKKAIDERIGNEFRWIDKAPQVESVYTHSQYVIQGLSDAKIEPEVLRFGFSFPSGVYPYTEITINEPSDNIVLCIAEKDSRKVIWRRQLKKEQLENLRGIKPIKPPDTDAKRFLQMHHEALCKRMGLIEPILLSLRQRGIINEDEEEIIKIKGIPMEKNNVLLTMIKSKGAEKELYEILQANDPYLVCDLTDSKERMT